ncbi:Glycosyl transferase family 2 [compost metagenome]
MAVIKFNEMNFADFTIIIPPHNRPKHLDRVLEYLMPFQFKHIVIADSSNEVYENPVLEHSTIHYMHLKGMNFSEKMQLAMNQVQTPYCMLMAEDDFYVPETIEHCVQFLRNNSDYSSCQGLYTRFDTFSSKVFTKFIYLNSFRRDINQPEILDRIDDLFHNYIQLFYTVHRTHTLKKVFEFSGQKYTNMFVIEILLAVFALIEGKHKVLNEFYGAREEIKTSVGKTHVTFHDFASEEKYRKEYADLLSELAALISEKNQLNPDETRQILMSGIQFYLTHTRVKPTLFDKVKYKLDYYSKTASVDSAKYKRAWSEIKKMIETHPI